MHKIFAITFFSLLSIHSKGQIPPEEDTLYINFYKAAGEFGGVYEGILIYKLDNGIKAKTVKYTYNSYGISMNRQSIIDFFVQNKGNYSVTKEDWLISDNQHQYLFEVLQEIKSRPTDEGVYSNANDYYLIYSKDEQFVYIDIGGKWKKYLELKKGLNIE